MAEMCSNCGAEESVGCELIPETGGMIPPRKFCRRCMERTAWRECVASVLSLAAIIATFGYITWFESGRVMESMAVRLGLLWLFQWLMTIPHELGHALMARWLGLGNVRIMIGTGRPFWSGEFLSFRWMFCGGMTGGFTFFEMPKEKWRRNLTLMAAAGPGVSVLAVAVALLWPGDRQFEIGFTTVRDIFVWSNVWVLAVNLWPRYFESAHGRGPNDGMMLLHLLAPGIHGVFDETSPDTGKPRGDQENVTLSERARVDLLRMSIFVDKPVERMAFDDAFRSLPPEGRIGYLEKRLTDAPGDPALLFFKGLQLSAMGEPSQAEEVFGSIDQSRLTAEARWLIATNKIASIYKQGDFARAAKACEDYLVTDAPQECKVSLIDNFVCASLFSEERLHMDEMEKWIRRVLEMAPQNASLHGTMGSVLVELGRFTEAEPHLIRSINSSALHDRAIGRYYLALVREAEGEPREAKRLIQEGLVYWSEPWLTQRATKALERLR